MQIDFHHAVTYVVARLAGFGEDDAATIGHAAQYVDDATNVDLIRFHNDALFSRIASAHKMADLRNVRSLANHLTWLPFHFLPGNNGKPAEEAQDVAFIEKIKCTPNSPIAQEMVAASIKDYQDDKPFKLHRLGVAMHVYADTWAHQGFAGELHDINDVEDVDDVGASGLADRLKKVWWDVVEDAIPPLGHGRAGVYPDMPFLTWKYELRNGDPVIRHNTDDFCEAADHMCRAMQKCLGTAETGIEANDMNAIRNCFLTFKDEDGEKRHKQWIAALKAGQIPSIDPVEISYPIGEQKGSWKREALGTSFDREVHPFKPGFLESDWKLFHDAIRAHRFSVVHEILPKYGICAA